MVLRSWGLVHQPQRRMRGIVRLEFGNWEHCVFEPSDALDEEEKEIEALLQAWAPVSAGGCLHLNEIETPEGGSSTQLRDVGTCLRGAGEEECKGERCKEIVGSSGPGSEYLKSSALVS